MANRHTYRHVCSKKEKKRVKNTDIDALIGVKKEIVEEMRVEAKIFGTQGALTVHQTECKEQKQQTNKKKQQKKSYTSYK